MIRARIGGWMRLGIVASILWTIGATAYGINSISNRVSGHRYMGYWRHFDACQTAKVTYPNDPRVTARDCEREGREVYNDPVWNESFWPAPITALIVIPFAWVFAWVIFRTVRWIQTGFRLEGSRCPAASTISPDRAEASRMADLAPWSGSRRRGRPTAAPDNDRRRPS
jgi:hypothetical protein